LIFVSPSKQIDEVSGTARNARWLWKKEARLRECDFVKQFLHIRPSGLAYGGKALGNLTVVDPIQRSYKCIENRALEFRTSAIGADFPFAFTLKRRTSGQNY
jgi:hypothetical protein